MKTKLYFLLALTFAIFSSASGQKKILFAGGSDTPNDLDTILFDTLSVWGYTVTYTDDDSLANFVGSFTEHDGLFFSETCSSSKVAPFKEAGYPIPAICEEGAGPRVGRLDLITNDDYYDRVPSGDTTGAYLVIFDNTHYITSIYEQNQEVRWTLGDAVDMNDIRSNLINFSNDIPSAKILANSLYAGITDKSQLWAIPENSAPLKERFVYFGTDADGVGPLASPDYYKIIARCFEWILGLDDNTGIAERSGAEKITVYPNPASSLVYFEYNAPSQGNMEFTMINIAGQKVYNSIRQSVTAGHNNLVLDVSELAEGIYIYQLNINGDISTGKMNVSR